MEGRIEKIEIQATEEEKAEIKTILADAKRLLHKQQQLKLEEQKLKIAKDIWWQKMRGKYPVPSIARFDPVRGVIENDPDNREASEIGEKLLEILKILD